MTLNGDPQAQEEEPSPPTIPSTNTGRPSPAPSGSSSIPDLTRSDSTPSSDKVSLHSHVSIPVVGTFPLGSLRVHKMDSPRLAPPTSTPPAAATTSSTTTARELPPDMPPLDNDDNGDVFLVLDLPPDSTIGCDAKAIGTRSAAAFQGIRNIPPGAHFLWISVPNAMSRCGYWFVTAAAATGSSSSSTVRVKQWDKFNEVLAAPASNFEARDYTANVARLYPQLAPYGDLFSSSGGDDDDPRRLWRQLTTCITEPLLARVTGKALSTTNNGAAAAAAGEFLVDTADGAAGEFSQPASSASDKNKRSTPLYQTLVGTGELHFLFPEGDVDIAALQQHGDPDTTADIVRLLETPGTGLVGFDDLLGELQFVFLTGLHLSNLSCVEQWWHLVLKVLLRAHALVLERPGWCREFFALLKAQMEYNEKYIVGVAAPGGSAEDEQQDMTVWGEYGGGGSGGGMGGAATSILDMVPGNKRRLREALTLYKRRMNELLLGVACGEGSDAFEREVKGAGAAFKELEAWFWRVGWDLRSDWVHKRHLQDEQGDDDFDDDDDYKPVIVDLDEQGREVGLISFN